MSESKLRTSLFIITLTIAFSIFYYLSNTKENKMIGVDSVQSTSSLASLDVYEKSQHDKGMGFDSTKLKSVEPKDLGADKSSKIGDLKLNWKEEFGCLNIQKPDNSQCEYLELNASSYEEALWMAENGYPSVSMLRAMEMLDDEDLMDLSRKNPNSSLPLTILANRYAKNGDLFEAEKLFRRSVHRNMQPFGLLRSGMSLVQYPDPNRPGWSYRTAAIQFKKAALLGDYAGEQLYRELINSYWNGDPGIVVTTDIIETAMWELSNYFDLPQHRWLVQQRPAGG